MSSTANVFLAKDSWQTPRNARTLRAYMALRNQEIAERLKELRARKGGPPQKVVAAAIGIEPRTLQTWEAGDAKPSYRNLEPLARYYGVSEEYILTGTENATPESPVVVSDRMGEGFEEFRQYVRDIRGDIAAGVESVETNQQLLQRISELVERQDDVLRGIERLLGSQTEILKEMRRVAGTLPTDENLQALNDAARELAELDRAGVAIRGGRSAADPGARRRQA